MDGVHASAQKMINHVMQKMKPVISYSHSPDQSSPIARSVWRMDGLSTRTIHAIEGPDSIMVL